MQNEKIEPALRLVKETQWVGGANVQKNLDCALRSMNFETFNGGLYNPTAKKISGVKGLFLVNKDGSIHYETRAIKQENGTFVIEYLTNAGLDVVISALR